MNIISNLNIYLLSNIIFYVLLYFIFKIYLFYTNHNHNNIQKYSHPTKCVRVTLRARARRRWAGRQVEGGGAGVSLHGDTTNISWPTPVPSSTTNLQARFLELLKCEVCRSSEVPKVLNDGYLLKLRHAPRWGPWTRAAWRGTACCWARSSSSSLSVGSASVSSCSSGNPSPSRRTTHTDQTLRILVSWRQIIYSTCLRQSR